MASNTLCNKFGLAVAAQSYTCSQCRNEFTAASKSDSQSTACPDCTYRTLLGGDSSDNSVLIDKRLSPEERFDSEYSAANLVFRKRTLKCHICCAKFHSREKWTQHCKLHGNKFKCLHCKKVQKDKHSLLKHMEFHRLFVCPICTYECERGKMTRHLRCHPEYKAFKCDQCDFRGKTKDQVTKHLIVHTNLRPYLCHICKCSFKTKWCLISHLDTHTDKKPYLCPLCPHTTRRRNDLETHMKIHSSIKDKICNLCDFKCKTKNQLATHKKKFHSKHLLLVSSLHNPDGKPLQCPECDFTCDTEKTLVFHFNTHAEANHICKLCNLSCKNARQLKMHMKTHTKKTCGSKKSSNTNANRKVQLLRCADCHFVTGKEEFMIKHAINRFHSIAS